MIVAIIKYLLHMRRMESYVGHLPSIPSIFLPFIGHACAFIGKSSEEMFTIVDNYKYQVESPAKAYLGPYLVISISRPDDVKAVLTSSLNRPYLYSLTPNQTGIFFLQRKKSDFEFLQV